MKLNTQLDKQKNDKYLYLALYIDTTAPIQWEWVTYDQAQAIIDLSKNGHVLKGVKIIKITSDNFIHNPIGGRRKYRSFSITRKYLTSY